MIKDGLELEKFKLTLPEDIRHERFRFLYLEFDIPTALFIINKLQLKKGSLDVRRWAKHLGMDGPKKDDALSFNIWTGVLDKDVFVSNIDISIPVIIAEIKLKKTKEFCNIIIDGNKRLRRAFLENKKEIDAYFIPWKYVKKFTEGL
jgi:hypothetical protein